MAGAGAVLENTEISGVDLELGAASLRRALLETGLVDARFLNDVHFDGAVQDFLAAVQPGSEESAVAAENYIKSVIRDVPDYPKPGINFKDINPLLGDPKAFRLVFDRLLDIVSEHQIDVIVGIESRGFHFASPLALRLGLPYVPFRKKGKLPGETLCVEYDLEYGTAALEMQKGAIEPGQRALVVDDLLATAGTACAACRLVECSGGKVEIIAFVVELSGLPGRGRLEGYEVGSVVTYDE